jgi:Rieske Fe-S protein
LEEKKPQMAPSSMPKPAVIVYPAPGRATQYQPPQPSPSKVAGRRNFVKVLITLGAILSITPYVPWGEFLSSSVSAGKGATKQKVVLDNDPTVNGVGAGKAVNVGDLSTFPPNSHWKITYPQSGDPKLDAQNSDTFVKYELIRLPIELGGDKADASSFVAFSKVCVHLWCSPNYNPTQVNNSSENGYQAPGGSAKTHEQYECPCHGSTYRIPDGLAVAGPASLQPAPTNAIPTLTLSHDSSGFLFIEAPLWDVDHNGVLGYGRFVKGVTGP